MEEVLVRVAPGTVRVRDGRCPKGCDLMDPSVPLSGKASIKLEAAIAGKRAPLWLNAFYGVYEYRSQLPLVDGQVLEIFCPHCGVSLSDADAQCSVCKIPMFTIKLAAGGEVAACPKVGCHNHQLVIVDLDAQLGRMYDDETKPMM
jgi:hypothetical protein